MSAFKDTLSSERIIKNTDFIKSCYEVMIHKLCNERCFFCSQDHDSRISEIRPTDEQIFTRILYGAKKWYWMLGFTWWEPLLHQKILTYIRFWKKAGFNFIRIQTNGVMLDRYEFAKQCVDAWATLFKFSVHHYKKEVHDWLVQLPWAFERVEKWIANLKKIWARIGINIVLTEQNYRDLPYFFPYFLDKGVTQFVIIFPLYDNSMEKEKHHVWFRYSEAVPYVVQSLYMFQKLGLPLPLVLNLPRCLIPWYEFSVLESYDWTAVLNLDGSKTDIDDKKSSWKERVSLCTDCQFNTQCYWVEKGYLSYWGDSEFIKDRTPLKYDFSFSDFWIKDYFSDDEICLLELLKIKTPLTIKDIESLKDTIQICQDCDSLNKIISTANSLESKGFLRRKLLDGKVVFVAIPS